eukprot:scaffold12.g7942.t1
MAIPSNFTQSVLAQGAQEEKGENARLASFVGAMAIADLVKSTLGPKGMDKILQSVSRGKEITVTNDGATILKSVCVIVNVLYVDNPAAKQDDEVGDGTTSVVVLAGELLREAEALVNQRVHPMTIIAGYREAAEAARRQLEAVAFDHGADAEAFRQDLLNIARTTLSSKILTQDKEHFAQLAVDAVLRLKGSTNLDAIQILKKAGGTIADSFLDEGFILDKRIGVGQPKRMEDARILVANTAMDTDKIKIYGARVRVDSMAKVADIEAAEKQKMRDKVARIIDHGINVFVNRQLIYNLPEELFADAGVMAIEHADFDGIERLALVTGGEITSTFDDPTSVRLGSAKVVEEIMVGEDRMIHFSGCALNEACTIVLRGASQHVLDEAERSLHDALCVLSQTVKDSRVVFGGGWGEMQMARVVDDLAARTPGKRSLAMAGFARALRQIPTTISDNAGLDSAEIVSQLRAAHAAEPASSTAGVDVITGGVGDMRQRGIYEAFKARRPRLPLLRRAPPLGPLLAALAPPASAASRAAACCRSPLSARPIAHPLPAPQVKATALMSATEAAEMILRLAVSVHRPLSGAWPGAGRGSLSRRRARGQVRALPAAASPGGSGGPADPAPRTFQPPHPLDPFQRLSAKSEVLNQLVERRAQRLRQEQEAQRARYSGSPPPAPGRTVNGAAAAPLPAAPGTAPYSPASSNGAHGAGAGSSGGNGAAPATAGWTPDAALAPAARAASPGRVAGASPALGRAASPGGEGNGRRTCRVRFWLKFRAEWGQRIKAVGSDEALGAWQLAPAPELRWSEGDNWHATVELIAGGVCEYKYVLLDHSGQHAIAWQQGNNSVLAVRAGDEFVEVFDNWGGDPGAKVVADGAAPVTRESRLLSWASEIEAQMSSQRQELRRVRMELAAAQEDAQVAREESAKLRAKVAEIDAARVAAVAQAAQATRTTQLMQTQLTETTAGFRQALETAADILGQIDSLASADGKDNGARAAAAARRRAAAAQVVGEQPDSTAAAVAVATMAQQAAGTPEAAPAAAAAAPPAAAPALAAAPVAPSSSGSSSNGAASTAGGSSSASVEPVPAAAEPATKPKRQTRRKATAAGGDAAKPPASTARRKPRSSSSASADSGAAPSSSAKPARRARRAPKAAADAGSAGDGGAAGDLAA